MSYEDEQLQALLPVLEIVDQQEPHFATGREEQEPSEGATGPVSETWAVNELRTATTAPLVMYRPTVLISAGDNLVTIAESLFHDPKIAWLIADLNKGRIRESVVDGKRVVEIRSRQQLDLPIWDEIVAFHRASGSDVRPENIVTIVEETRLDPELLQSTLATAMGVSSAVTNQA